LLRWLKKISTPEDLFHASRNELLSIGVSVEEIKMIQKPNWSMVEKDLTWSNTTNHAILLLQDTEYPFLLKRISDPPFLLYVKGNKKILSHKQLAIVGSRKPSPSGIRNAERFAYQLSSAGFVITSGLALGIDAASHKGALAAEGATISVFGTGLNHVYPSANQWLASEIIDRQGAIISEFSPDTPPKAINFPLRNRIIAGLSLGVLVVEAAQKSGSLITAHCALEQGREVFAMPGSIHNVTSKGCHHLIKQGAKLVENIDDILEELLDFRGTTKDTLSVIPAEFCISNQEEQLLKQIGYETTPIDMIILRAGLTRSEVSSILLSLELQGCIQTVPGGFIRVN